MICRVLSDEAGHVWLLPEARNVPAELSRRESVRDCGLFDSSILSPELVGPVEDELNAHAFAAIEFGELAHDES